MKSKKRKGRRRRREREGKRNNILCVENYAYNERSELQIHSKRIRIRIRRAKNRRANCKFKSSYSQLSKKKF